MADTTATTGGVDARILELEARLRELERREERVDPLESLARRLLPADAREHLRAARREQLLALRSLLDHWIARAEGQEAKARRERIAVD